jgi:low molecular weight protein-tyrosine phosphatase
VSIRVCFVCLGNICRSPTAEGVMRHLVEQAGLADRIEIDSAGTGAWHVGEPPDRRARAAARTRGIELTGRARRFEREDWARFDYVLAMDRENYADLEQGAPSRDVLVKLELLRAFDPNAPPGAAVPDPYYGGHRSFDEVIDLCLAACRGLLEFIVREHGL